MQVILDSSRIDNLLNKLADEIAASFHDDGGLALVGVRSRGEILAQRLQGMLADRGLGKVQRGTLDITLYRDDLNEMGTRQPVVRTTEIDFDVNDRLILLVDDVLSTGRSVRAALSVLLDLGRPKAVRLAVLLDRGSRELPVSADFIGEKIDAPTDKIVQVYLREVDDREEVVLE